MNAVLHTDKRSEYWKKELKACISELPVYMDAPRNNESKTTQCLTIPLQLDSAQAERLSLIYNLDVVWLTCYVAFLHRMSNETDLLIGMTYPDGQLLPLRVNCTSEDTMKQLIGKVSDKLVLSLVNSMPLPEIKALADRSLSLACIYGEYDPKEEQEGFMWSWHVRKQEEEWLLHITYNGRLFADNTVERFASHFKLMAQASIHNIHAVIGSMDIVTDADTLAYRALNNTAKELPAELNIVGQFASVVKNYPSRIAFSSGEKLMTYQELDRESNKVARMLLNEGFTKGEFAAIFMERSIETVVSLLGVLKAGGTYIPLDPEHPEERNAYIISDTASRFIITKTPYKAKVQALYRLNETNTISHIFDYEEQLSNYSDETAVTPDLQPDDLAYVIYTSGSTGRPKGALIPHKGVVNLAMAIRDDLQLTEEDVLLQYSTFSFDASVYDVFGSMLNGSRLHLLSYEERFSIDSFTKAVQDAGATRISILPTVFFNQLATYLTPVDAPTYSRIKSLVVGGEALPGEAVRQFQKKTGGHIRIVNAYGPTECTVAATSYIIDEPVAEHVSTLCIGTPLANYELYILNSYNRICPVNVTGELLISSVGVGKGYLNQPEKTAEVFITDPLQPESGKVFYRSGDMVRLLANGLVEYMGRKDSQVKIRGYRIEIGEIEDNLVKHEAVKDAAVIAALDASGEKRLVAFYTSADGAAVPKQELVQFLSKKVPGYMVPEHFQWLASMPVTPSGKVDRKALAALDLEEDTGEVRGDYVPPVSDLEKQVCAAWEKALRRTNISVTDNFFEIGGHSIKVLEILAVLKPSYPNLKINDFFQYPTIEQLSARISYLAGEESAESTVDWANEPVRDLIDHPARFGKQDYPYLISPQEHIFLTGSTGYLGSHILFELLERSAAKVYCLVRPHADYAEPLDRLAAVMTRYFGKGIVEKLRERVVMVQGDLEKEDLGLQAGDRYLLNKHVDSIIHCGAEVKHFGDAEYFTRVNVDSTRRLLDLARTKENTRFHYISTLGIPEELALSGQWDDFLASSEYLETAYVENVYTESKLEAERLAVLACEREGIPVSIYRVGNLSCRSDNGLFQQNIDNNAFYRMLKAMILLGVSPVAHSYVDLTPVDYAGASITTLLLQNDSIGGMFHICNPVQLSYVEMVKHFQNFGYEVSFMELKEYESWLLNPEASKNQEGLQLAMAQLEGDGAKHSSWRFACPQTVRSLEGSGVVCQLPDQAFIARLIDHAVEAGYFPKTGQI
jgi:amino acid adenylation domain-containing protein/thioester reductase-like protein